MASPHQKNAQRLDMNETRFRRTVDLSRSAIDRKARTVALSFSSEYPVDRGAYKEVLSHTQGDVDLSRLNDGHPVLLNHNTDQHVGVIEKAWVDAGKGRAIVKFSRSTRGEEVWQDVLDGVLKHISVGYQTVKEVAKRQLEDGRELIRFAWAPYEVSIVPVPADPTVGIGRSKPQITMNENEDPNYDEGQLSRRERRAGLDVEHRTRNIRTTADLMSGDHPHLSEEIRQMASEACLTNRTPEAFNASVLSLIRSSPRKTVMYDAGIGMSDREISGYSFLRLCRNAMNGKSEGPEFDYSQQYARSTGQSPNGVWVPPDVLRGPSDGRRDLNVTTASQGGNFVQTNVLSSPIEILRNRMVVQRLGAQYMGGLSGNVAIPRQTGAATAYSLPESASLTKSTQAIDQITLTPKRVGAYNEYTKQLLLQSSVDVENFLRDDLMKQVAIKWDGLAIAGEGSGSQPTGILNTTGVGSVTFSGAATYAKMVSFETSLSTANADLGRLAYVTTPAVRGKLKLQPLIGSTFPVFIWQKLESDDGTNDGMVNDYRAASTNQVPNDLVIYGNWQDLIIAQWGGYDVVVNPFSRDIDAVVRITVNTFGDIAIRHAASFTTSSDTGAA
jgi:HK97 family phage prohead protease